ncbi:uncharacterized protein LOC119710860 isoform X2 [Motacilla alba alba]|uniref:uncharacterized protein LOC119710860 isoform X2 n=1 Tax=Motacilla alba alba TaxID=1094192 RepID=UPI0018D4E3E7|nr:uncharacterized protein LOC119710860 isoform X2 [Motacilla alba alba]
MYSVELGSQLKCVTGVPVASFNWRPVTELNWCPSVSLVSYVQRVTGVPVCHWFPVAVCHQCPSCSVTGVPVCHRCPSVELVSYVQCVTGVPVLNWCPSVELVSQCVTGVPVCHRWPRGAPVLLVSVSGRCCPREGPGGSGRENLEGFTQKNEKKIDSGAVGTGVPKPGPGLGRGSRKGNSFKASARLGRGGGSPDPHPGWKSPLGPQNAAGHGEELLGGTGSTGGRGRGCSPPLLPVLGTGLGRERSHRESWIPPGRTLRFPSQGIPPEGILGFLQPGDSFRRRSPPGREGLQEGRGCSRAWQRLGVRMWGGRPKGFTAATVPISPWKPSLTPQAPFLIPAGPKAPFSARLLPFVALNGKTLHPELLLLPFPPRAPAALHPAAPLPPHPRSLLLLFIPILLCFLLLIPIPAAFSSSTPTQEPPLSPSQVLPPFLAQITDPTFLGPKSPIPLFLCQNHQSHLFGAKITDPTFLALFRRQRRCLRPAEREGILERATLKPAGVGDPKTHQGLGP